MVIGMRNKVVHLVLRVFRGSDTAKCNLCGSRNSKSSMFKNPAYGFFCSKDEYVEFWEHSAIF